MELMCKAKSLLYFDEILYVYCKEQNTSTIDNYTVRKALDFTIQTLEYLHIADKYEDKRKYLIKMIEKEGYIDKVSKLYDWIKNDKQYTYEEFIHNKKIIKGSIV